MGKYLNRNKNEVKEQEVKSQVGRAVDANTQKHKEGWYVCRVGRKLLCLEQNEQGTEWWEM